MRIKSMTQSMCLFALLACGDPIVDGDYLGEPFSQTQVVIQPYQAPLSDLTSILISADQLCSQESPRCLVDTSSEKCQIDMNRCVNDLRSQAVWTQDPQNIQLSIFWISTSSSRGQNGASAHYSESLMELSSSLLWRGDSYTGFPSRETLDLHRPPPSSILSEVAPIPGESAVGIVVAFWDHDENKKLEIDQGDRLVGIAVNQGLVYIASNEVSPKPEDKAKERGDLHRINRPFCTPPSEWYLSADPMMRDPLVISLVDSVESEDQSVEDTVHMYLNCEAGITPLCNNKKDLVDVCSQSGGDSSLCGYCLDQLSYNQCDEIYSQCESKYYEEGIREVGEDALTVYAELNERANTCPFIYEGCLMRSECQLLDLYCELDSNDVQLDYLGGFLEGDVCDQEMLTMCYQDQVCILNGWTKDIQEWESRYYSGELYDEFGFMTSGYYECIEPIVSICRSAEEAQELMSEDPEYLCVVTSCEAEYLACEGVQCEEVYIACSLEGSVPEQWR